MTSPGMVTKMPNDVNHQELNPRCKKLNHPDPQGWARDLDKGEFIDYF